MSSDGTKTRIKGVPARKIKERDTLTVLHVMGVSVDQACAGHTRMCIYICATCVYKHGHSLWTSRKVFHFIRAVSLEIASDGTVRGDGPSAARYVSFFQDTFSTSTHIRSLAPIQTHMHTYTRPPRTIIKKIEGEGSLLIRPANCGTSPSNPSAILDPIIFQGKPRRPPLFFLSLSPPLSVWFQNLPPSSSCRDPPPLFLFAQWNMDICVAIRTNGWRARSRREFPLAAKLKYFHYNGLSFSFCRGESARWISWYRKCPLP